MSRQRLGEHRLHPLTGDVVTVIGRAIVRGGFLRDSPR